MATKIYAAEITFGKNELIIKDVPLKKIPLHIHLSESTFQERIKRFLGKKNIPVTKIEYIKYLSNINQEPESWI